MFEENSILKMRRLFVLCVILILTSCTQNNELVSSVLTTSSIEIGNEAFEKLFIDEAAVFIYIGRSTCPVCTELEPILVDVVKELNVVLYYYDTDVARTEDEETMTLLLDRLEIMSVPTIIYVVNGEIVEKLQGMQTAESLNTFFKDNCASFHCFGRK